MSYIDPFLPECRICQFYTCNVHLRCAVHPNGVKDYCLDFTPLSPQLQTQQYWQTSEAKDLKPSDDRTP